MKSHVSRLCLILAAMDLRQNEIVSLLEEIRETGISKIIKEVELVRRHSLSIEESRRFDDNERYHRDGPNTNQKSNAILRAENLLKGDARLSTRQAIEEMSIQIISRYPDLRESDALTPIQKKGLAEWLIRLLRIIPERELLHFATVVRNRYVDDSSSDWLPKG
ncbi:MULTISPECIES: hypothetical protein [Burkholderia cepacia complex]|uniref:hypothetical protein n=1 Tax=Burkholderia cepacia complex TaxID=87882 RepID=UPI001B9B0CA6|nr:hypothetical protein [Burkholderia cenocepacia]MBR8321651.1 hypothetical protein [Burkholderia cenocepacia]